ncbi:MAG: carbohydrate ABC transporter permease [Chloroflexi bacterium]|nr:carbohydrate ABC transporter permease [Chloroflexota bacterium]OQA94490.1 MAG: L-arabinose transport system permease protein AraQ [Chloroflexi bacterium ADurb.Bin222]HOC22632.1 carbohydrate ABC transporter permease [Anaerolineae bacterium]HOS80717.1 carbohydrate ABC transporter permease [Anaerolineae bacterium]HQF00247.1 carbohydrate ABC transporter permease [Anaerolineae bacterium]
MTVTAQHRRAVLKRTLSRGLQYLVLVIFTLIVLVPIVILVFGALKTRGEMYSLPYTIPNPPHWENFGKILSQSSFWTMLRNSLLVMVSTTLSVLAICSLAAFVFARLNFKGKNLLFNFLTLGLMFPITVAIMPVFLVIREMQLTNTHLAVILVQTAFQISGNIMILHGFFQAIPTELQDAAYIDGCNAFDFFWRILLPLARPALSAVGALTMIASWNDLLTPLVFIDKDVLWTLPLGTMQFQGQYGQDLALVAAFVTLSAVPTLIFYLFAERQIVSGLTAGALKG